MSQEPTEDHGSPIVTNSGRSASQLRLPDSLSHVELKCGWKSCKPKPLQRMNTPKWFLFFLVVFSMAQGMIVNGFTNVGLSTLEKQFKLNSKQSGMIVGAKEISALLLIAFLSYYGSFGHKPKYLGTGALVTAFGSLLYVLPHGLIGKHIPDYDASIIKNTEVCSSGHFNSTLQRARCEVLGSSEWYYMLIFVGAKLLLGAGTAPLFTLGAAYIDENVKPKVAPMYLGIWYATTFFGPGIGFVAGGSLLTVYVDLIQPPGMNMSPDDPRWIGAWWLGHFFGGLLIFITSCALLAYPRYMPGARAMREQAIREGTIRPEDARIHGKLKEMIPATVTLLKNPMYVFNTLALSSCTVIATGLGPFIVKYLQTQFGASTSKAGIASGIVLIPGTAGGIFIGSFLIKRLKQGDDVCRVAAKYCFIFQVLAIASVASFLIPGCDPPNIVGVHQPYFNGTTVTEGNLTSGCNAHCYCDNVQYSPVCGIDKVSYYAPCQAGCSAKISQRGFGDCSCIDPRINDSYPLASDDGFAQHYEGGDIVKITVVRGLCDRHCKNMVPFLLGAMGLLLLNFVNAIPSKMVVMRCVPDNERAYALGLQWIFLSVLGSMPGPVLFGIFIDKSCDLWERTCTGRGNCLAYNNVKLSYLLTGITLLFQILAAFFYFLSWKSFPKIEKGSKERPLDLDVGSTELERNDCGSLTASNLTEATIVDEQFKTEPMNAPGLSVRPLLMKETPI